MTLFGYALSMTGEIKARAELTGLSVVRQLDRLMDEARVSQTNLGAELGLSQGSVSKRLSGAKKMSLAEVLVTCEMAGVSAITVLADALGENVELRPRPRVAGAAMAEGMTIDDLLDQLAEKRAVELLLARGAWRNAEEGQTANGQALSLLPRLDSNQQPSD